MILSRCYDPADHDLWPAAKAVVDRCWDDSQHPSRKWEYALALQAIDRWLAQTDRIGVYHLADVGGGGSPFWDMLSDEVQGVIIDPAAAKTSYTLRETLADHVNATYRVYSIVTCLSVLEHVEDLDRFCYHLSCLLAPGGLLVLTVDCCGDQGEERGWPKDVYHWHWLRTRIFSFHQLQRLRIAFRDLQLHAVDDPEWVWHEPLENWGYCPASLVLQKRS